MEKAYIYRITNHNNRKEYKRTKCTNHWINNKEKCWKFSIQGAKNIIKNNEIYNKNKYYTYGYEIIEL